MERGKFHVISISQAPINGPRRFLPSIHAKSPQLGAYRKIRIFFSLFAFVIFVRHGVKHLVVVERNLMEMATQEALDQYLFAGFSYVRNADGVVSVFRKLWVEYRFCNPDNGTAWSAWMTKEAIFRPFTMDACRLSGSAMNDYYYIGIAPITPTLSVASTKGGMSSQLN